MLSRRMSARAAACVLGTSAIAAAALAVPAQAAPVARAAAPTWPICDYRPAPSAPAAGSVIDSRYNGDAGLRRILGAPTGTEQDTTSASRFRAYQNGELYYRAQSGVGPREVHGQILEAFRYTRTLDDGGIPLTDECPTPTRGGRYNDFGLAAGKARASIYWRPDTGPVEVDDNVTPEGEEGIHDHWQASGWENGVYGWPVGLTLDTSGAPGRQGRRSEFEGHNGFPTSIYWGPESGTHGILGLIRKRWVELGREISRLGYPTSDEFATPTGRRSNFQHGCITFDSRTGTVTDSTECA